MSYQKFFFLYVEPYIIRKVVIFYFQICVTHASLCIKTETVQNVLKTMSINVEFGSYFTDSYNNYKIGPLE